MESEVGFGATDTGPGGTADNSPAF